LIRGGTLIQCSLIHNQDRFGGLFILDTKKTTARQSNGLTQDKNLLQLKFTTLEPLWQQNRPLFPQRSSEKTNF
jgi:hypothetical protein